MSLCISSVLDAEISFIFSYLLFLMREQGFSQNLNLKQCNHFHLQLAFVGVCVCVLPATCVCVTCYSYMYLMCNQHPDAY